MCCVLCFWGLQQLPRKMRHSTWALLTYSCAVHFTLCGQIPSHLVFSCLCIVMWVVLRMLCYCCRDTSESTCNQSMWASAAVRSYLLLFLVLNCTAAASRPFWSDNSASRAPSIDGRLFFSFFAEVRGPHLSHMMDSQMKCLRLQCLFPALTSEARLYCKTLCFT